MATPPKPDTNLPPWQTRLRELLPKSAGVRARDAGLYVRTLRDVYRARPGESGELELRAFAPSAFGRCVGVIPDSDGFFLIEAAEHGQRLDRTRSEARYQQLAMLVWALHCGGYTIKDVELQRILATDGGLKLLALPGQGDEARAAMAVAWARAFITGRKATTGLRADRIAPLVLRVLGGETAAAAMLRARLGVLPDVESWRTAIASELDKSLASEFPRIVIAADTEQALAIHALACEAAIARGVTAGDGALFMRAEKSLRLLGPLTISECATRLGRLSPGPTLAIVVGASLDVARELEHVGQFAEPVSITSRGLFDWLRPLGVEASLAVEMLAPVLEREPARVRRTVAALIERAGAGFGDDGPYIAADWVDHWQTIRGRRTALSVLQPDAVRVAQLIALSPGGLDAEALEGSNDHKRGAAILQDVGLCVRERGVLRPAEGAHLPATDNATRRVLLNWLAERDHFAPNPEPLHRDAWRLGLRLRAGDLACWEDDGAEKLLDKLVDAHAHEAALQLIEAHAAGSVRSPGGPPSIDVLLLARDLGFAHWKPRRVRRVMRMWLRGYDGELRALGLALQGQVERKLGGIESYGPLLDECVELCNDLPRFPREQAQIEAAYCCCFDDPARALNLLRQVGDHPARAARYLCEARILRVKAECEFVAINIEESYALVQQAREKLTRSASRVLRARTEADIEVRHMVNHNMLTFYKSDSEVLLEPVREIQKREGCCDDILRAAIVNDYLMRMRMWEVGLITPEQVNFVLAEARPDNIRGYLVALFQLEENAIHRGDCGIARQLSARIEAIDRSGHRDQAIYAAWRRHQGVLSTITGEMQAALCFWRMCRSWHIPAPWGTRTKILRQGEWGYVLMAAGKWDKAARTFQLSFDAMAGMSASGRGSVYLMCRFLCDLLAGRKLTSEQHEYLDVFIQRGYIWPRIVSYIAQASENPAQWSALAERIDEVEAPEFWKAIGLSCAAVLARHGHSAAAEQLAWAARNKLQPDWVMLHQWLDAEFPAQEPVGATLTSAALRAIVGMQLPRRADARAYAELAEQALRKAGNGKAAVQIGLEVSVFSDGPVDSELAMVLERALMGETVDEPGLCALGLRTPFGAIAVKAADKMQMLPLLKAVAQRLRELHELGEARMQKNARRVQGRDAVRAAWALASGDASPAARLSALRTLVVAETGAQDCLLSVLRGGVELLTAGNLSGWTHEAAHAVDTSLQLRARISGGDGLLLDEAMPRAARTFAAILQQAPERLRMELGRPGADEDLFIAGERLGRSPASRRLYDDLRRYADLDLPVIVIGEPGSGKDLAVRALHAMSSRSAQPLVVVDCPTLRRETAASELFGHVRGAFTGATQDHVGLLERAGEGVLQVDGIGDLDPAIQAMLLRAFQVRTFLPVGATSEREFKARIVISSGVALAEMVEQGRLRDDLAQRLQGVPLNIPPLRDRGDDAVLFARDVLEHQGRQLNRKLRLTKTAEKFIRDHDWPGNVRELKSAATRAGVMANTEQVGVEDLHAPDVGSTPSGMMLPSDAPELGTSSRLVLGALRQLGTAQPQALVARLGLSRTTVSTSLSELAKLGYAEREGRGRATTYRAL